MNTVDSPEKQTILVIDDEPINLKVLTLLLSDQYRVRACKSGLEALEILAKFEPPDLVLLDIILPDMGGYAVLAEIRADYSLKRIPVILISAMDSPSDEKNGRSLGADDYIPKPFAGEMVLEKVREQLIKSGKGVL